MSSISTSISTALGSRRHTYQLVDAREDIPLTDECTLRDNEIVRRPKSRRFRLSISSKVLAYVNLGLLVLNASCILLWLVRGRVDVSQLTYTPASSAVSYATVVFSSGFGIERSPFQGQPTKDNNKLWQDLYDFGITRISPSEARPMSNKTLPIPDERGGYIVQLSVFHQLHCLNLVRRGLYGEVDNTDKDELLGISHLDHCIDTIRQSVMCHSDVTPLTFARQAKGEPMKAVAEVIHSCRNFEDIQRWALERRIEKDFDKYKVVRDDPLSWGDYEFHP